MDDIVKTKAIFTDIRRFSPTICLTYNCNLNCIYCYQKHNTNKKMSFETAKKCIDYIFDNIPNGMKGVEIGFIGGEPLLEFELIKKIVDYTKSKKFLEEYIFYATTNGTLLDDTMKEYFKNHCNEFILGLSLDGKPETHNHNRSNSFSRIDIDFFLRTYPKQGVKMTLSEFSLPRLADDIIYLHSLGFNEIGGVNLFEGTFDWSKEEYIKILIPQLSKLVDFYVENDDLSINQMLNKRIEFCGIKEKRKWCGIGTGAIFFDVDGTKHPCPFCSPMTFDKDSLDKIELYDFNNNNDFIDDDCFNNCYIYSVCPYCSGANYLTEKSFKKRSKNKCRITKLITLFAADLFAKRIVKNPNRFSDTQKVLLINSIQKIKELFLPEFKDYLANE